MPEFTPYEARITRGRRRGQVARVVGAMNTNEGRRLTCKFRDGSYEMILERYTEPLKHEPNPAHGHRARRTERREQRLLDEVDDFPSFNQ